MKIKNQHKIFSRAAERGRLWLMGFIILMISATTTQTYAQTLNMWWVPSDPGGGHLDLDALRTKFPTVTVNGIVHTNNVGFMGINFNNNPAYTMHNFNNLPTSVSGYAGVNLVKIDGWGNDIISQARADALVAYVKQGGILVSNMEGVRVGNAAGPYFNKYVGEALLTQPSIHITSQEPISDNVSPVHQYHRGIGTLGLTGSAPTTVTTGTNSSYFGIPSESIVYSNTTPTGPGLCGAVPVLDFIAPSYPGGTAASSAGTNGFAYLSGEIIGPLSTVTRSYSANVELTGLIYDFLHNPSAMATRRAWSQNPANVNPNCPATSDCIAPTTISLTPASQTVDLMMHPYH